MLSPRWCIELVREAFQVSRPSMSLMTAFVYLYDNPNPSLLMTLYFGFIFQLGANAGNDYMDWERDREHEKQGTRDINPSRGKARSKDWAWRYYMFGSLIALLLGVFVDPFFGAQYFVIVEVAGQWAYNGVFMGFPINELSFVKTFGFPFDIIVSAWTYTPFPYLVGQQRWTPGWTIYFWGATMVWGQIKDYDADKANGVRTTATFLGEFWCSVFVSVSAIGMIYRDVRFLPYGLYTLYKCYMHIYGGTRKAKGKLSVMMALNLVAIVWCDRSIPASIKVTSFLAHISAYFAYKYYPAFERRFYAVMGALHRSRPYDKAVWEEEDPNVLLWKIGSLIGRSGSAVQVLFGSEDARFCMLGYVYFRAQATWADVCLDSEDRVRGLAKLPKRLEGLMENAKKFKEGKLAKDKKWLEVPDQNAGIVRWDDNRSRNELYVDVTKEVHRFDRVFVSLPEHHQQILLRYANDTSQGWVELEKLKDAPVTHDIMRKHSDVTVDAAFYAMCRGIVPDLLDVVHPESKTKDTKVSDSYIAFSDYIWYMNLAATIEEDVVQGVALDDDLRKLNDGYLEPEVITRVRIKWLCLALAFARRSQDFLLHPHLVGNWTLRTFILQFLKVSLDVCEKLMVETRGEKYTKSSAKTLVMTFVESWKPNDY